MLFLYSLSFLILTRVASCQNEENFGKRELFIQSASFGFYLYRAEKDYHIYVADGGNKTVYSYPISDELIITFDGDFTINHLPPNIIIKNGTLSPPPLIKNLFKDLVIEKESIQICYDFSTERVSLKVAIGLLSLFILMGVVLKVPFMRELSTLWLASIQRGRPLSTDKVNERGSVKSTNLDESAHFTEEINLA